MEEYFEEMTMAAAEYELNDDASPLKSWEVSKSSPVKVSEDDNEDDDDDNDENNDSGGFDCNICLDSLQDPVVTFCGHMYCWPCIYKWIHSQTISSEKPQCPVCKSKISEKTLIPLYGRGGRSTKSSDTTAPDIPKRPQGPPHHQQYHPHHPGGYMASPVLRGPGGRATETATAMELSQPMIGVLGEVVYPRMFGISYPNSYNLGAPSVRRMRGRMMEVDRSFSKIFSFLLCFMIFCLLLF